MKIKKSNVLEVLVSFTSNCVHNTTFGNHRIRIFFKGFNKKRQILYFVHKNGIQKLQEHFETCTRIVRLTSLAVTSDFFRCFFFPWQCNKLIDINRQPLKVFGYSKPWKYFSVILAVHELKTVVLLVRCKIFKTPVFKFCLYESILICCFLLRLMMMIFKCLMNQLP